MKLFISFSGGRTSAYMTWRLLNERRREFDDIRVIFANTGKEHEETLRFVDRCGREFGFGTIWVEAVVHEQRGTGTTHKVVSFETASRRGEPFEAAIAKFGVPNKHFPHCTRELKQRPMYSYLREVGWKPGDFQVAIGIRADEIDRVSEGAMKSGVVYPLVSWGVRKVDVIEWWRERPFDLRLPEHLGNCDFCWKKSLRKHLTLAVEHREVFDFPREMEARYGYAGPGEHKGPRRFFRGNRSADDILALAQEPFNKFTDPHCAPELDLHEGCEDSCEVFTDSYVSDLSRLGEDILS